MFRLKTITMKRPLQNNKNRSKMLLFARSDDDRCRSKHVALKEITKCCVVMRQCVFMQFGGNKEIDTIKLNLAKLITKEEPISTLL
jgi:hypothetical protein